MSIHQLSTDVIYQPKEQLGKAVSSQMRCPKHLASIKKLRLPGPHTPLIILYYVRC